MSWKKQKINSAKNKEYCIALLLGGTIYDESAGGVQIVPYGRRRDDETRRTNKDVTKDLFLWERDFRALTSLFQRNGTTIWRSVPTAMYCSKVDTMERISTFFSYDNVERQENGMAYDKATTFIVYWCGHGEPTTGNWSFSEGEMMSCAELINIWTAANREERDALTVISDSCYSGAWIDELRAKQIPNLAYQAACCSDETAWIVDDRNVPRSLLMRKFFLELLEDKASTATIVYTWTCTSQHPIFFCDYANEDETAEHATVRGALNFFTIKEHTRMGQNYYNAERNGSIRHGKFLKIVKK